MRPPRKKRRLIALLSGCLGCVALQAGELTDELARQLVGEVTPRVEQLRGLSFQTPVPVELIDDAGARRHVLDRLDRLEMRERLERTGEAYQLLGLLPENAEIIEIYLDALREQAGGFYNPATGSYYLLDDMPMELASTITAHELTHALEDQHFDLDGRLREVIEDDDRLFARAAVHEGSATLVMTAFTVEEVVSGEADLEELQAQAEAEAERTEALTRMPQVLLRQLLGPYVLGVAFLNRGAAPVSLTVPVADIDRAYRDGPSSSEQILHPEKFWDPEQRDDPVTVHLDGAGAVLGASWTLEAEGVLGEISLALLVGAETPVDPLQLILGGVGAWIHDGAAGWDGDRWQLWSRGEQRAVLLASEWDSEQDAAEFVEALPVGLPHRLASGSRAALVVGGVGKKKAARLLKLLVRPAS